MPYNSFDANRSRGQGDSASTGVRLSGDEDLTRLSTAMDLTCDDPFSAVVWTAFRGAIVVTRYKGVALSGERTERHLADMFMSHVRLSMPLVGVVSGEQEGAEFLAPTGGAGALRFDRPLHSAMDGDLDGDIDVIDLYLPISAIVVRDINPNAIAGKSWQLSPESRTAVDFLAALLRQPISPAAREPDILADVLSNIALLIVADGVDPGSAPPVTRELDLRRRAFDIIDAHFTDPDLSPDAVAAALHVSPRSLFRAFEESGTSIGRLIHQRRLSRVAMALEGESSTETIAALAHAYGFHGADQLTRAFRKQFGTTPSEFRARHRT